MKKLSRPRQPIQRRGRRRGFTLLELLIVLGIIVAIAAMVAPNLISSQQDANIQTTQAMIKNIEDSFKRKAVKNGGEYQEDDSVAALAEVWTDNRGQEQQPLLEDLPVDAWGNEFQYSYQSGDIKPKIWSFGPNRQDDGGSGDDISNMPNQDQ